MKRIELRVLTVVMILGVLISQFAKPAASASPADTLPERAANPSSALASSTTDYALSFRNADKTYIRIRDAASLRLSRNFTIEAWIYQMTAQANGYRLVDKETGGTGDGYDFDTYDPNGSGRRLRLCVNNVEHHCVSANTVYSLNQPHHVAAVVTGGIATFYLDGQQDGSSYVGNVDTNTLDLYIGGPHVGCGGSCGLIEYFNGNMHDVRLWDIALSTQDIQQSMYVRLTGTEHGLVGYWRFNEGHGTTAADSSGHGNTGTLVNGPRWISSVAFGCDRTGDNTTTIHQSTPQLSTRAVLCSSTRGQSMSGAASISGIPFAYPAYNGSIQKDGTVGNSVIGFWLKIPSLPPTDTSLIDFFDSTTEDYSRLKLTSSGHVVAEYSLAGSSGSGDLSRMSLTPNVWYWISYRHSYPQTNGLGIYGIVETAQGAGRGITDINGSLTTKSRASMTATLGIGKSVSTTYAYFPNAPGWEMSKIALKTAVAQDIFVTPPAGDASGPGYSFLYMDEQTIGPAASLTDTSGHGRNATAASPPGLTINADGPYTPSNSTSGPSPAPNSTYARAVLADHPVSYWQLNETAGSTAKDATGHGHDGQYVGGVKLGESGPLHSSAGDNAASFDGTSGYVSLPGTWGGPSWKAVTVEAWVYARVQSPDFQAIVEPANQSFVHFQLHPPCKVEDECANVIYVDSGTRAVLLPVISQSSPLAWHYVVMTGRSGDSKIYVDGVERGSNGSTFSSITAANSLRIGSGFHDGRFFNGRIADVAIYNHVLRARQ